MRAAAIERIHLPVIVLAVGISRPAAMSIEVLDFHMFPPCLLERRFIFRQAEAPTSTSLEVEAKEDWNCRWQLRPGKSRHRAALSRRSNHGISNIDWNGSLGPPPLFEAAD
jgi:hypothetical protein